MTPQLSVILPLYNQADFIVAALDDLAAQDMPLEIIVVDDASTDGGADRVAQWAALHPHVPLCLKRHTERRHALSARLTGLEASQGQDIMFMDADDRLLGRQRLARILAAKRLHGCDIAHFRSQEMTPSGELLGEFAANAPLTTGVLRGEAVFAAFAARHYPPVLLWGKLYSRTLLEQVAPFARGRTIFRFDDKFLVSLLMLHAQSYLGCDTTIYRYKRSESWPMTKFAGRVHDLRQLEEVILPLLEQRGVAPRTAQQFRDFLQRRHIVNMGRLCIEAEQRLFDGEKPETVLDDLLPFLDEQELFASALLSARHNVRAIMDIVYGISYDF